MDNHIVSIYGTYEVYLPHVLKSFSDQVYMANKKVYKESGEKLFEHFSARIKSEQSMREKCEKKGLEICEKSALKEIKDAIGVRIVCAFVDDIYKIAHMIKNFHGVRVCTEKDYVYNAKPNGYRSYHMIIELESEYPDCEGNANGKYFIEVQLRTIAMDSWAALEHQMRYKRNIQNAERIARELKRCADELASCDLSMQTIRNLIKEAKDEEIEK